MVKSSACYVAVKQRPMFLVIQSYTFTVVTFLHELMNKPVEVCRIYQGRGICNLSRIRDRVSEHSPLLCSWVLSLCLALCVCVCVFIRVRGACASVSMEAENHLKCPCSGDEMTFTIHLVVVVVVVDKFSHCLEACQADSSGSPVSPRHVFVSTSLALAL